jgi:hypothetical protein
MDPSCRERLLQTISQHPSGVLVQALLAEAAQPGEHQRMLNALRGLILCGHVINNGQKACHRLDPPRGRPIGQTMPRSSNSRQKYELTSDFLSLYVRFHHDSRYVMGPRHLAGHSPPCQYPWKLAGRLSARRPALFVQY